MIIMAADDTSEVISITYWWLCFSLSFVFQLDPTDFETGFWFCMAPTPPHARALLRSVAQIMTTVRTFPLGYHKKGGNIHSMIMKMITITEPNSQPLPPPQQHPQLHIPTTETDTYTHGLGSSLIRRLDFGHPHLPQTSVRTGIHFTSGIHFPKFMHHKLTMHPNQNPSIVIMNIHAFMKP